MLTKTMPVSILTLRMQITYQLFDKNLSRGRQKGAHLRRNANSSEFKGIEVTQRN